MALLSLADDAAGAEEEGTMYCNHCGNPVSEGSRFCNVCGKELASEGPPPTGPFPRPWPITAIGILDIVGGVVVLPMGALVFLGEAGKDPVAAVIGLVAAVLGTLTLSAGIGLLKLKPFARTLQLVLSAIGLIGFPLGTLISILILIYLAKPAMKIIFSGRRREEMTSVELASAAQVSGTSGGSVALVVAACVLIALFFVGMVAAIAIPNLLNAIDRGRQKRTMADMRTIAVAMESYAQDRGVYPSANSVDELRFALVPTYLRSLPAQDGWQQDLRVRVWQADRGSAGPDSYAIISAGKGGAFESEDLSQYRSGPTTNFSDDIVFANGSFFRSPAGQSP
jgi:type II secretory pathway pseudopilin PulG